MTSSGNLIVAWDTCVLLDYFDRKNQGADAAEVAYLDILVREAVNSELVERIVNEDRKSR